MKLPESRANAHTPDYPVQWAHTVSSVLPHNHVISERETSARKNALGDHIDRYHAPTEEFRLPEERHA